MRASRLSRREQADVVVYLLMLVLAGVGLVSFFLGVVIGEAVNEESGDRLSMGGVFLFFGALLGMSGYVQFRYGITFVHASWRTPRMRLVPKTERPLKYWFTTVLFSLGSIVAFVAAFRYFLGLEV